MSDQPDNLVMEHLRAIRGDIDDIKTNIVEVKECLNRLEEGVAGLNRHSGRTEMDVHHIMRRLDIVP